MSIPQSTFAQGRVWSWQMDRSNFKLTASVCTQGRPCSCMYTTESAYLHRQKWKYRELMSFFPHLGAFNFGLRDGWMLRESWGASPAPERQQGVRKFSSGFCFRFMFVLKQRLCQNMFPHRHFSQTNRQTERYTHTHTKWYICKIWLWCVRCQFCFIYSGLLSTVMEHLPSLPHPLILIQSDGDYFLQKEYRWLCTWSLSPASHSVYMQEESSFKVFPILKFPRIFKNHRKWMQCNIFFLLIK